MFPFFPRDRDLCTRMPIKLCLRNDDSADPTTVLVRFQTETKTVAVEKAAITIADWMEEINRSDQIRLQYDAFRARRVTERTLAHAHYSRCY